MEEILKKLEESIYKGMKTESERLTREALAGGIAPLKIIEASLQPSLARVGDAFEANELFLPELVSAGDSAIAVGHLVEQALGAGKEIPTKGAVAIGTIKGDIHNIGKNLVGTMLKANGFKLIDLGIDVSPDDFLAVAGQVDAIGISSLLHLSTRNMKETIDKVRGKHPSLPVIIGGAGVDPALAENFGVLYGPDAASAPKILESNIKKRR